ncbi:hypothetical protein T265_03885 [Opisthorchis viverrini]|uniref:non-specific serine/threonine protein kinase n=1 Tax=Opisthorchis viverrini TaxID=6198 RepID=A0A075A1S5_OPIVI|nr:hypothetical protein T265_03885 [Opisthorchis viverrini]KER29510.1 hypothetical protein T265_03885 [Opisthorchis viverrini]
MKKILARLAQSDSDDPNNSHNNIAGSTTSSHFTSFLGRHFRIGKLSLVVDEIIAEGGFGVVFRVRSQQGQYYALKRTCVNSAQNLAICKREITIVSSLSHKNILRSIDSRINRIQDGIFEVLLLTAYYPGSLSHLLSERQQHQQRLTEVEVLRIFCDLCEAVCRLHHCKTPIIHRDLKVENILIDERQNFVLCDFGSATSRVLHPAVHGLERCQEEINKYTTLAYRAPEMINLYSNVPLGPQIDIWALGCLLYCLCFTALPFGDSALAIQSGIYSIPDTSPYSERLHRLIGYLLQIDAAKRPDIFQVSALAFSLTARPNPAQNLNNLPVPHWQDLSLPPRESQLKALRTQPLVHEPAKRSSVLSSGSQLATPFSINSITLAPRQRPRGVQMGSVTTENCVTPIKPPPPPSSTVRTLPQQNLDSFGSSSAQPDPFVDDYQKPLCQTTILEHEEHEPWEADFSNDLFPTRNSSTVQPTNLVPPNLDTHRGHHRTWSVDVSCVSRFTEGSQLMVKSSTETAEVQSGFASPPHCRPSKADASDGSWMPLNNQLRQVQSLMSLPTSSSSTTHFQYPFNRHKAYCPPLRPSNSTFPENPYDSACRKTPVTWSHGASDDTRPLGSAFYASNPKVDEDELFGAAFDAIRKKPKQQSAVMPVHSTEDRKPVDQTC